MKIRAGFVSNSSSSSYICDVCGECQGGYDYSLSDAGMYECERGHVFCECHLIEDDITPERIIQWCKEEAEYDHDDMPEDPGLLATKEDMEKYRQLLIDEVKADRYLIPAEMCPICTMHDISDNDLRTYLIAKCRTNLDKLRKEFIAKFKNYDEFLKYIQRDKR